MNKEERRARWMHKQDRREGWRNRSTNPGGKPRIKKPKENDE